MTLIVGFEAENCFILAADSLSTTGGRVTKCDTIKIHKLGPTAVIGVCGLSKIQGQYWDQILANFNPTFDLNPTDLVEELEQFLNAKFAAVDKTNFGACKGGNTFIVVAYDKSGELFVYLIVRVGDQRAVQSPVALHRSASTGSSPAFPISWWGDDAAIKAYTNTLSTAAPARLTTAEAVELARNAVLGGIGASRMGANPTIGGLFVRTAAVSQRDEPDFQHHATQFPCHVDPAPF